MSNSLLLIRQISDMLALAVDVLSVLETARAEGRDVSDAELAAAADRTDAAVAGALASLQEAALPKP